MAIRRMRDWRPGGQIPLGDQLQEGPDAVRELAAQVSAILFNDVREPQERFLVRVVNAGPNGESDYSDARYWLKRIAVLGAMPTDNVNIATDDTAFNAGSPEPYIITGINFSEFSSMTHGLPVDGSQIFECFGWWDAGSPNRKHYFFVAASGIPAGTGRYKVLMLIDALNPGTPGWDYPRFY
jgi:hypothetical protein